MELISLSTSNRTAVLIAKGWLRLRMWGFSKSISTWPPQLASRYRQISKAYLSPLSTIHSLRASKSRISSVIRETWAWISTRYKRFWEIYLLFSRWIIKSSMGVKQSWGSRRRSRNWRVEVVSMEKVRRRKRTTLLSSKMTLGKSALSSSCMLKNRL